MQYRSVFVSIPNPFSIKDNIIIVTKCNLHAKLRCEKRFRRGLSVVSKLTTVDNLSGLSYSRERRMMAKYRVVLLKSSR